MVYFALKQKITLVGFFGSENQDKWTQTLYTKKKHQLVRIMNR